MVFVLALFSAELNWRTPRAQKKGNGHNGWWGAGGWQCSSAPAVFFSRIPAPQPHPALTRYGTLVLFLGRTSADASRRIMSPTPAHYLLFFIYLGLVRDMAKQVD
jgi:hypothetical protein